MNLLIGREAIIVGYCRSGGLSVYAAQSLNRLGDNNAYSLKGALNEWALSGLPYDTGLGVVVKAEPQRSYGRF